MAGPLAESLFDCLRTTAGDLRDQLEKGTINSVQIVESCLSQIEKHNRKGAKCRAIISTPPRFQLISTAAKLDRDRAEGRVKGPLHGIPILLKDVFATDASLGMPTTAGSYALLDSRPSGNAEAVKNCIDQGVIILGKSNMTEFLGKKGESGWSAVGGMCEPAYIPTGYKIGDYPRGETTPAGSSTGSAVGVACGFAPIALGTETSGSIVSPAAAAALYALKLTPGSVSLKNTFHLTASFDTVGAFVKTTLDVAMTADLLAPRETSPSMASVATEFRLEDLSVGFVDIEKWRLPKNKQADDPKYFQQTASEYEEAKERLRIHGVKVMDAYIQPPEEYLVGDTNVDDLMDLIINHQGKNSCDRYLEDLEYSKVRCLEDIITFNDQHAEVEFDTDYCPNQNNPRTLVKECRPDNDMDKWLDECKRWAATEGVDRAVSEQGVDVVVCDSDSYFAGVSVAARYPMAAVPLGYIESSGRPYGLQAVAPAREESKLIKFMAAWENISPPRRVPDLEACEKARAAK